MRITLVISSMTSGGAERVMSMIANFWASRGDDVTLITYFLKETDFYKLHPSIKRVNLGLLYKESTTIFVAIKNNYNLLSRLREAIKSSKPEVVISFMDRTNVVTLIATTGLIIPVIISERTNPKQHSIGPLWNWLRSLFYSRAEALVIQTTAIKCWAKDIVSSKKLYVIPNPVLPDSGIVDYDSTLNVPPPFIVSMGRLDQYKGFDKLLEAFSHCHKKHPQWSLIILGEGPQRKKLESYSCQLGISSNVHLPGRVLDPNAILKQAEMYVLSSKYEGFPNALLEAMSCGLPVVSFDCSAGPRDIVRHGQDGLLVPPEDVKALEKAIESLIEDQGERKRMGAQARKITERFSMERIMEQWDDLLNKVVIN